MNPLYSLACCEPQGSPSTLFSAFFGGLAALVVVAVVISRWLERRRADRLGRWPLGIQPGDAAHREDV